MAHAAQQAFFARVRAEVPSAFTRVKVLDCGSLDVNGTLRDFFTRESIYVGVDLRPGRNVDIVGRVDDLTAFPDGYFDTVVSAEMLEHDEFWPLSLRMMYRLLRPGGLLAFSCAAPGRAEHGTRTVPDPAGGYDGLWGTSPDYYRPLNFADVTQVFRVEDEFIQWWMELEETHHDLYCWGLKR